MSFLNENSIAEIGFKNIGKNVKISDKASFYNPRNISIGDNTRIDDFCVLSAGEGGIEIGRNVHLSVGVTLIGSGKILLCDFSGLSAKCSVFSSNDDYSGRFMTNPTVNPKFTNVTTGDVIIGKHVVVGAGSIILPNVSIGDGASVGSLSLVKEDCKEFWIYVGVPVKAIKERKKDLLKFEKLYNDSLI